MEQEPMSLNLETIRNTWAAFEQASGLGPIRDDAHYTRMVELADALTESGQAGEDGALSNLFAVVCELIGDYDDRHFPLPAIPPREMLRFLMEQHGLKQSDLPEVGTQSVVSEILSGRRMLNARQIAALAARFGVGADVFLEPAISPH